VSSGVKRGIFFGAFSYSPEQIPRRFAPRDDN
jgi:hypothetical protein